MRSPDSVSTSSMDAQRIIETARSGARPAGWFIWSLRRDRVRGLALRSALYVLLGLVVFVPIFLVVVPSNFQHGALETVLTLILLGIPATLLFYSTWALVDYLRRLVLADQYLLVITPTDYLKVQPRRLTHVAMSCVGFITLKGAQVAGNRPPTVSDAIAAGGFLGVRRPPPQGRSRGPTSLAFRDRCANRTVVVGTDDSFEELLAIEEVLRLYAPPDPQP